VLNFGQVGIVVGVLYSTMEKTSSILHDLVTTYKTIILSMKALYILISLFYGVIYICSPSLLNLFLCSGSSTCYEFIRIENIKDVPKTKNPCDSPSPRCL
jgi:hypothetical protein